MNKVALLKTVEKELVDMYQGSYTEVEEFIVNFDDVTGRWFMKDDHVYVEIGAWNKSKRTTRKKKGLFGFGMETVYEWEFNSHGFYKEDEFVFMNDCNEFKEEKDN